MQEKVCALALVCTFYNGKLKVETSTFAPGTSVNAMLKQAEELFAARFGMCSFL
jgi:hypothetical protein